MKFEAGDKVSISPKSQYAGQHAGVGTLSVYRGSFDWQVNWPDGYHNSYDESDLIFESSSKPAKPDYRVGDKVRVIEDRPMCADLKVGDIVKIENINGEAIEVSTNKTNGFSWSIRTYHVEPLKKPTLPTYNGTSAFTVTSSGETVLTLSALEKAFEDAHKAEIGSWMTGRTFTTSSIFGDGRDGSIIIKQKKGSLMKKLSVFLKKSLDKKTRDMYKLGWVSINSESELLMTSEGIGRYIHCMVLGDGDFAKYAASEVAKALKEEKKEEESEE